MDDPLDLADLGLAAPPAPLPDPVETDVAVAEAIADSVTSFASSLRAETAPVAAFTPALQPVETPAALLPPALVPAAYQAEFRQLGEIVTRTALQRTLQAIVVCGVEPNDHAAFVTENLSLALAENPSRRIARFSLVSPATSLVPTAAADSFRIKIQRTAIPNLSEVVPLHGALPIAQLLRECDIVQMIEMLKARFDFILLETDAVNFADEVATFAGKTDGVILVAQKEYLRGQAMSYARAKLQAAEAIILGAVLNRNREPEQLQRVA
jgi:Mrp family chromosome partitioning ATPase